jgi:hypothetical protein
LIIDNFFNFIFVQSMTGEPVEGPVSTEEFMSVRRALAESQAKIQQLVQVKSDLERHLTDMHHKVRVKCISRGGNKFFRTLAKLVSSSEISLAKSENS